ncbi:MAG: hypothetical protein ABIP74_02415 [Candidatus Saccharimonas sp.]
MKTSMKHINEHTDTTEHMSGKASVTMIVVYVTLFGAWLALQLHK